MFSWGANGLYARGSYQYLYDPQGSVSVRTNSSGQVVSYDLFDAYGTARQLGTGELIHYNGQWGYLRLFGLYLCTYRFYDQAKGRWVNRDPIGYRGGVNLYGYCGDRPVGQADSRGTLPGFDGDVFKWIVYGMTIEVIAAGGATILFNKLVIERYVDPVIGGNPSPMPGLVWILPGMPVMAAATAEIDARVAGGYAQGLENVSDPEYNPPGMQPDPMVNNIPAYVNDLSNWTSRQGDPDNTCLNQGDILPILLGQCDIEDF